MKTTLIILLNSFSKKEQRGFKHFVSCKYFNTDRYACSLLNALNKHVLGKADFDEHMQGRIFPEAFPDLPLPGAQLSQQESKLLNMKLSALTRLAKRFLTIEAIDEKPACESELLLKKLVEKKQFHLMERQLRKEEKKLEQVKGRGIEYYKYALQIETGKLNFLFWKNGLRKEDNLSALMKTLDLYYLLNKQQLHSTMLSLLNSFAGKSFDFESIKAIEQLLKLPQYAQQPTLKILQETLLLIRDKNPECFFSLLDLLEQYTMYISRNELISFYNIALNFCAAKIRSGALQYCQHSFDIYKSMDQNGLLPEGNFMPPQQLKNLITVSCQVEEFDWAKQAIEKYRSFFNSKVRDSVCHFNYGAIAFYQKNYMAAITHFIRVENFDPVYDINCKLLLLKSYYELDKDYDDKTVRKFRTVQQFIRTNKNIAQNQKTAHKNFISLLIRLYETKHNPDKKGKDNIRQRMEKYNLLSNKQWLLEKLNELQFLEE